MILAISSTAVIVLVLALAAVLVVWGISVQNSLVKVDEICQNALKQISVQQTTRYDALEALVKLTREYASYESETLIKVIAERKLGSSAQPTVEEINRNEATLGQVRAQILALAERYPDLKANQNYQQTMKSIENYEENVRLARMTFNDTVTKYNQQVRSFPGSVVASLLHFAKRDYLADEPAKKDYPAI